MASWLVAKLPGGEMTGYPQIEASTCPPGIPWAFDAFNTFAVTGSREFDYQCLPGGGEFDPHALGVGNLNCTLDVKSLAWRAMGDAV